MLWSARNTASAKPAVASSSRSVNFEGDIFLSFKIDPSFIANYKVGDNISYNAGIIRDLYSSAEFIGSDRLYKPRVVFNVSLIDAAFYDFIYRIKKHTIEFNYLDGAVRGALRRTNLRTFSKRLDKFRNYSLLGDNPDLYDQIKEVSKLRNRVHIQNEQGSFEADDEDAFTKERLIASECCTEFTLKYLSIKYPRSGNGYLDDIELPWDEHFSAMNSSTIDVIRFQLPRFWFSKR